MIGVTVSLMNKNLIRQARQTNLPEYLLRKGEPLKKDGYGRYRHAEHESLVFTQNAYYWNARGEHGNSIDYLVRFCGMDFKTAIAELTNQQDMEIKKELVDAPNAPQAQRSMENFSMPDMNKDMRRVFAYLIKSRNIDSRKVQKLAKDKLLFQDQRGNAVFPWYDEHQNIIGGELHGTLTQKRFKGILDDSMYGYGFNITIGSPKAMYTFESAIDLLSYWTLYPDLTDRILVSMAGLKLEVIQGFLNRSNAPLSVFLCVDNDQAGDTFANTLQSKIQAHRILPQNGKDWNEYLLDTIKPHQMT